MTYPDTVPFTSQMSALYNSIMSLNWAYIYIYIYIYILAVAEGEPPEVPIETTVNIAAIVGGTVGGVVLVILVTLLGLYLYWRHEPRDNVSDPDVSTKVYERADEIS